MNKLLKNALAIFLTATILNTVIFVNTAHAESLEKVYCQATMDDDFTDNEILIITMPFANFKEYNVEDFESINCINIEEISYNIKENVLCRIIELTIDGHNKQNVLEAIKILEDRNDIYSAQPNYIYQDSTIDTALPAAANNSDISPETIAVQSWMSLIELTDAWNIASNSNNNDIKIGIVDGIIDTDHTYLSGYFNDDLTYNIINNYGEDIIGHGTKVAGVIVSVLGAFNGESNDCTSGIELVSFVTQYPGGFSGNSSCFVTAINAAGSSQYNIDILNMSVDAGNDYDEAIKCAIMNFSGLIVCAAGNGDVNLDESTEEDQVYPAYYNYLPNVISVGASTTTVNLWDNIVEIKYHTSNYGSIGVDLFAPGDNIQTTASNNDFTTISETSSATPIVTGVAALMLKVNPNLRPDEIKHILCTEDIGTDRYDGNDEKFVCYSEGRLNAKKAVNHASTDPHMHRGMAYDGIEDFCCDTCDYIVENHSWRYIASISNAMHTAICRRCGAEFDEGHDWESLISGGYRCRKCLKTSNDSFVPGIMGLPPETDEEETE